MERANLPNDVEQVLIGSLLGDGAVSSVSQRSNACFAEYHCNKQIEYLHWKAKILSSVFGGHTIPIKRDGNEIGGRFCTRRHHILTEIRKLWYPNGKKIIPETELYKVNALGLAIWYQDDGSYSPHTSGCNLAVDAFKGQELFVQTWFQEKWGVTPHLGPSRFRLYFSLDDTKKMLNLVAPFIHHTLIYKLGRFNPANLVKIEQVRARMREHYNKYYNENRDRIRQRSRKSARKYYLKNREGIIACKMRAYWEKREQLARKG